ncbi:MAG TPA: FMN-binding protein [Candidatus Peribacteraceae bacterium]|nr:FMN-binding protein [Candidatus Peribacteraceae bacterium]
MKQFIASAALIVVFGFYIAYKHMGGGGDDVVAVTPPAIAQQGASSIGMSTQTSSDPYAGTSYSQDTTSYSYPSSTDSGYQPAPSSTPADTQQASSTPPPPASSSAASRGMYKDGTYTGAAADAFYGNIQVDVTISGGKISNVQFLDYPHDRGTSVMINQQAMPYLKQEAIQAQSAPVDIVSGATDSSGAFNQSLASALNQARNS